LIAPPPEAQDLGPWRIDLVLAIWPRIARTIETLRAIGAVRSRPEDIETVIRSNAEAGCQAVEHRELGRVLCVMAAGDNMHVGDWLRRTVAESHMPRRKPPAPADLAIRLRGLACKRLVARINDETESYRVTILNLRGDVASCESYDFINALEGAIKMAGARADRTEEP
jgi:hypothetical protein